MKATDRTRTHQPANGDAGGDPWLHFRAVRQAMERLLVSVGAGDRPTAHPSGVRGTPHTRRDGNRSLS